MKKVKRQVLKFLTVVIVFSLWAQSVDAASLSDLIEQRNQLNDEWDKAQSAANNKAKEAKTLGVQIKNLDSDISTTEKRIGETGLQIDQAAKTIDELQVRIAERTKELVELKKKLNRAMVEVYRFSSRSNLELLLSGSSLGRNSNEVRYVEAVEIQIKTIFTQVETAKKDLETKKSEQEKKKKELDDLRSRQEAYKKGVEYQKSQKDQLLGMTLQQKEEYEAKAKKIQSEISSISAEIYRQRQTRQGRGTVSGGGSAYSPMSGRNDVDAWGFVPYQCTSYAAWYWNIKLGKDWENTRPGSGSAYNWANLARDQGYSVSSNPRVGAIVSWGTGLYPGDRWGHVAIVEKINSDGTIDVSEYNYAFRESYSYRSGINPADEGVSFSYIY